MERVTKTHLAHGIEKTEKESQYDDSVKELLSDKQVLARIAQHRMEEFRDYDIETIMECIEGEPEISKRLVYPGKRHMEAISGMNSESKEVNEGELSFDIRFYMVTKDKKRILEQEHQMKMTREMERGIHSMCNVSEGLVERGIQQGLQQGIKRGIQQGLQQGIQAMIRTVRKYGASDEEIVMQLMEEFQVDKIEAENYLKNVE